MLADASLSNELRRLLAEPLALAVCATLSALTIVPIMTDRSRHRPGNVAPIQLISAIGAWALLFLNAASLVSSVREHSPIVACACFATLLTTLGLFLRREGGRVVDDQAPETIEAMIREIEQILGGAWRVGIKSLDAVIVEDTGPFIGVSVSRRGSVVVRVRQELMAWLEKHRRPGGAGSTAVESLLRFTFLHELGHVLNGDHLNYRFVRSVLLAHLCWAPAAVVATALLPWGVPAAQTALITSACLALPFLGQCLLARRFLAEREEEADLRAMQTLDPSDASLLATRSGRRTDRNPTLLEKLMTDLHVQEPVTRRASWLSKAVQWVWPEAGHIHERCELLALGRGGRMPRPNRWAALMGMQCGLLCTSLLACTSAAFSSLPVWQPGIALRLTVIQMMATCAMAATYCGMRVDPALVRLHDRVKVPARWAVGAIFYCAFSASALLLYLLPALSRISAVVSYPLFALSVGISAAEVLYGSSMAAVFAGGSPENAAISLRHPVLRTVPMFLINLGIAICAGGAAAWVFGLHRVGSGPWNGVTIVAFAGATTTFFISKSTNAAVRAIPPIAVLDSSGGVYAIRIFWREFYFDRHAMSNGAIVFIGLSTYAGTALLFGCGAAFAARLMSGIADKVVFDTLVSIGGVLMALMILVPRRAEEPAHLTDLEHLRMFDSLLTAVRTARLPVAEKLGHALARWVDHDAGILAAVLPEPRAIWRLESLLLLVRIARGSGEEKTVASWRSAIADALRRIVTDGAVSVNGSRPSLAYTVLAAQVIDEADLAAEIPLEPILDSIADRLELCLNGEDEASAQAMTWACRLLGANGRSRPGVERMRMQCLMTAEYHLTRPIIRYRLCDFVAYIALLENADLQDRLASIARARMWEALQLNPENDVSLLLDCYLTAISLGENDSTHLSLAASTIGEVATRIADELTRIYGEP
jgi:hypothetical protein